MYIASNGSATGDLPGVVSVVNTVAPENPFIVHGWFLWAGWGVLGFVQIVSMRYMKTNWLFNYIFHVLTGLSVLVIGFAMSLRAIIKMGMVV